MNYEDFYEQFEQFLVYAQKAIDIYDEIYEALPKEYKQTFAGVPWVPHYKALSRDNLSKRKYSVDRDEARLESDQIEFIEILYERYDTDQERTHTVPYEWLIPDENEQRRLISLRLSELCAKIDPKLDVIEEQNRKAKERRQKEIADKKYAEYLKLKAEFE